jgi:hypothetical protein
MAISARLFTTAALACAAAAPALAQYQPYPQQGYPQPYPQQYPQQYPYPEPYPPQYPEQGYPYPNQPYATTESAVGAIVDSLIGNRYAAGERQAIHQCAWAAAQRAQRDYGQAYPYGAYPPQGGAYPQPYSGYRGHHVRVTAITGVEHRSKGVRVHGLIDAGLYRTQPYDPRYGYGGPGQNYGYGYSGVVYNGAGDLTFRCDVDHAGAVHNIHLDRTYRAY